MNQNSTETATPDADRWTYLGRRMVKGTLRHCFRAADDEDGVLRWWKSNKASLYYGLKIGEEYALDEGKLPQSWISAKTGAQADEDERVRLQVLDRSAELEQRAKKVDRSPDLLNTVEQLRVARRSLSAAQRVTFDAWLLNSIR